MIETIKNLATSLPDIGKDGRFKEASLMNQIDWAGMEVGDGVTLSLDCYESIRQYATRSGRKYGRKFSTRKRDGKVHVIRMA